MVTSRTRVDDYYTSTGIRSLSVDWNEANLNNSFATSERTGSVEYLADSTNHTGYAQTIVKTTKSRDAIKQAELRPIAKTLDWNKQRQMWRELKDALSVNPAVG